MALITVIVPVFNISKYLPECLDSIIAQTFQDWTCILINDGSTDGSQSIIDDYCERDARFLGIIKENEKSADLARKYAFKFVQTEWVIPIDGDDIIVPDYIERMVCRQIATGADIVMSRFVGCLKGVEGINFLCPDKSFDMNQILPGKLVCINNIGGWSSSLNGALYKLSLTKSVFFGPYMNSDEFSQRQIENNAHRVAFCNVNYLYRNNIGTSLRVSALMFDRTLVDMQLEQFVCSNFPEREDKIKVLAWQRLFNLIYLTADYYTHRNKFSQEEQNKVVNILTKSYIAINRKTTRRVAPVHSLMLTHSFTVFAILATMYVRYKRSHGGKFFYR